MRLCVNIVIEPVDNPADAVLDECNLKVDEQAKALVGKPEISQKLLLVNKLYGLGFNDDLVFDDQLGPES